MLRSEEIDIVTVATPDHLHADVAVHAAGAGVKGILCEKPIRNDSFGRGPDNPGL
jgi:predicted dehydrogenase